MPGPIKKVAVPKKKTVKKTVKKKTQPAPPRLGTPVPGVATAPVETGGVKVPGGKKAFEIEMAQSIFEHLASLRKTVDEIKEKANEEELDKQLNLVPVNLSDLMKGFQGAVTKANNAARTGEGEGEDIETMMIRDLEVNIGSPIVSDAHAEDPVIMLPNINGVDDQSARVTLKFNIVSIPLKQGD